MKFEEVLPQIREGRIAKFQDADGYSLVQYHHLPNLKDNKVLTISKFRNDGTLKEDNYAWALYGVEIMANTWEII